MPVRRGGPGALVRGAQRKDRSQRPQGQGQGCQGFQKKKVSDDADAETAEYDDNADAETAEYVDEIEYVDETEDETEDAKGPSRITVRNFQHVIGTTVKLAEHTVIAGLAMHGGEFVATRLEMPGARVEVQELARDTVSWPGRVARVYTRGARGCLRADVVYDDGTTEEGVDVFARLRRFRDEDAWAALYRAPVGARVSLGKTRKIRRSRKYNKADVLAANGTIHAWLPCGSFAVRRDDGAVVFGTDEWGPVFVARSWTGSYQNSVSHDSDRLAEGLALRPRLRSRRQAHCY